ncbi:DEAD/DEAH box helicase [Babesia microti strain RI]|uniref:RNA helicase n=1 Tax=Babesia microti (strain RI) TaxID=1133968 RepID=I7IHF4_BABMR|nr:DEAD/DEAH box helicase [Babesia microti strain RI]CCF75717.1 DEAD/DEAH box helicase [Babesia microti strain RI]|eukprot:XP_012650125.1 DEAD/DEAH box helicase [Babesia microti strain RI]
MSHIFRELCYGTKLSLKRNNNYVYKEKIENDISGKSNSDLSSSSNGTDHVKSIGSSHFSDEPPSESYLKTQRITITNPQNSEIPAKWPLLLNFSHLNSLLTSLGNLDSKSNYKLPNSAPKWLFNNIRNNMNLSLTTPIQQIGIPAALLGSDILGISPTGSGKTLAYLIPLLIKLQAFNISNWNPQKLSIRSLIIAHTRELAHQIDKIILLLTGFGIKCSVLRKKNTELTRLDICISTPLTLIKLLRDGNINLNYCKILIMDEADKLFDLGFESQIDEILSFLPKENVQRLLFSATMHGKVRKLVNSIMIDYYKILVGTENAACTNIAQELICVTNEAGKLYTLRQMFLDGKLPPPVLVFISSREKVDKVFKQLANDGIQVAKLSAMLSKKERDATIQALRTGMIWILLCTDILARGVDFPQVSCVVNFDIPTKTQVYIHRVGRTGRAGRKGRALTFYTIADIPKLRPLTRIMKLSECELPDFILEF